MAASVLVGLSDDPCRSIRDSLSNEGAIVSDIDVSQRENRIYQVNDLSGDDEVVKVVHDFFDRCFVVPHVDVKEVDVVRPEIFEALLQAQAHRLCTVSLVVDFMFNVRIGKMIVVRVLESFKVWS